MANGAAPRGKKWLSVFALALLVGGVGYYLWARPAEAPVVAKPPTAAEDAIQRVPGAKSCLSLSPSVVESLGVRTTEVRLALNHDSLNLSGSLFLDPNRMVRVHSRFAGEVVSIGPFEPDGSKRHEERPLRLGDRVRRGQLLAVIWAKDVGEKKSDLVNALSKLYLDQAQLDNLRKLGKDVVAERQVREAEREREADIIEVDRVERTLRSWRLTEPEIQVVRAEAEKIHRGDVTADLEVDKSWAEVEVRSPFDGIVLEKNIVSGDIVDTTLDLFRIADLNVLGVLANVYEEDLPALEALPREGRNWTVYLKAQPNAPGIAGTFELIGNVVDPNQHTAAVMGWLDNRDGRLRAGQFVTATVPLSGSAGDVVVPDTAVVEDGSRAMVFVASDAGGRQVTRRRVALISRGADEIYIRSQPTANELAQGCEPLLTGEWVVTSGCIELDNVLADEVATATEPTSK